MGMKDVFKFVVDGRMGNGGCDRHVKGVLSGGWGFGPLEGSKHGMPRWPLETPAPKANVL